MNTPKTLEEYLSLPYTIILRRDVKDEIFVARVDELPGCSAHGDSEEKALSNLHENMQVWIEDCLESGEGVPEPEEAAELPSGKWLQRVPRSLHLKLVQLAKREGVSLNQLVTSALAEVVGSKKLVQANPINVINTAYCAPYSLMGWSANGVMLSKDDIASYFSDASMTYLEEMARAGVHEPNRATRQYGEFYAKDEETVFTN